MQVSFYVLSDHYLGHNSTTALDNKDSKTTQNTEQNLESKAVLCFICKLTQTVLKKSSQPLLILDDNQARLAQLDDWLWSFEASSFIPHQLISAVDTSLSNTTTHSSPVLLSHALPPTFTGVVLNLASQPLPLASQQLTRLLEIITPDEISKQQGRDRYRHYRQQGFELNHYSID